jgi:hypothetical protein
MRINKWELFYKIYGHTYIRFVCVDYDKLMGLGFNCVYVQDHGYSSLFFTELLNYSLILILYAHSIDPHKVTNKTIWI